MINPNVPLSKPFHYRLAESDLTRSWTVNIITSRNEPSFLPRSMSQGKLGQALHVSVAPYVY